MVNRKTTNVGKKEKNNKTFKKQYLMFTKRICLNDIYILLDFAFSIIGSVYLTLDRPDESSMAILYM